MVLARRMCRASRTKPLCRTQRANPRSFREPHGFRTFWCQNGQNHPVLGHCPPNVLNVSGMSGLLSIRRTRKARHMLLGARGVAVRVGESASRAFAMQARIARARAMRTCTRAPAPRPFERGAGVSRSIPNGWHSFPNVENQPEIGAHSFPVLPDSFLGG